MQTPAPRRFFIVGPTASGKGRLAVLVARRTGGEILSVDSMKVYRGMNVASATLPPAARAGVPFHLVDIREPWEHMSAAQFVHEAERAERDVLARGRRPIFCGGTGLYVRALTEGLFDGPPACPELRQALRRQAEEQGPGALHARLAAVDAQAAARLHPNDLRRVIRALEVFERTGTPISRHQQQWRDAPRPDRLLLGVRWERQALCRRIDARVERMVRIGLVDEVRRLLAHRRGIGREAGQALGVRELVAWIGAGEAEPLATVVARIQTNTRRFARRQHTFLSHFPDLVWLDVDETTDWDALALEVVERQLAGAGERG